MNVLASADVIKQRQVRIVFNCNGQMTSSLEVNVMPLFAPVDHVFRYNEPEHSYFKVRIPPFLQFNQQNLTAKVSKVAAQVDFDVKTSEISVQSKTGDSMQPTELTVYLYSDSFMSNLLATIRIEVMPLTCIFSQTKAGV